MDGGYRMPDKALFIVNSLAGGGAERVCVYLANAMAQSAEVDMVVLYDDDEAPDMHGVNVVPLGMTRHADKAAKIAQLVGARKRLNRLVTDRERDGRYGLITAHLTASHVVASLSCVADRCLYVHHSLPTAIEGLYPAPLLGYLERVYRRGQSVSVSEGVRRQAIERFGVPTDNIATIYNCVPLDGVREGKDDPIPQARPFILCVGRLAPSKRFDRMVEAYAEGGFANDYDLVFLGQGQLEGALKAQAASLGVGGTVRFPGYVDNPYAWMSKSSAMVMTSEREALPTVLVEGLMAGACVVSSDCDFGPREILTGELADFLVPPDSNEGYIGAIRRALRDYPAPGLDYFARYRADEVIRRYAERYQTTFPSRKGARFHAERNGSADGGDYNLP